MAPDGGIAVAPHDLRPLEPFIDARIEAAVPQELDDKSRELARTCRSVPVTDDEIRSRLPEVPHHLGAGARHRMTIDMPNRAKRVPAFGQQRFENRMVRRPVLFDATANLRFRQRMIVDGPLVGCAGPDQSDPLGGLVVCAAAVAFRIRREHCIGFGRRAVRIEINSREMGVQKCRPPFRGSGKQFIDIQIRSAHQHVAGHGRPEIRRKRSAAVGAVENHRNDVDGRVGERINPGDMAVLGTGNHGGPRVPGTCAA